MSPKIFPTAQDAENAFYEALERSDLEGMMAVWAEDEDIVCVHPGGPRLTGQDEVRESWARIFKGGGRTRVQITHQVAISAMMLAVHSVSGIAIASPIAVVISARLMSSARFVGSTLVEPVLSLAKADIMPSTVPKSPSIGALLMTVATQLMRYSRSARTSL